MASTNLLPIALFHVYQFPSEILEQHPRDNLSLFIEEKLFSLNISLSLEKNDAYTPVALIVEEVNKAIKNEEKYMDWI